MKRLRAPVTIGWHGWSFQAMEKEDLGNGMQAVWSTVVSALWTLQSQKKHERWTVVPSDAVEWIDRSWMQKGHGLENHAPWNTRGTVPTLVVWKNLERNISEVFTTLWTWHQKRLDFMMTRGVSLPREKWNYAEFLRSKQHLNLNRWAITGTEK